MGPHRENEIGQATIASYLRHAPSSDGQFLMAYVLGGTCGSPAEQHSLVGNVCPAGGPFGVKVCQALRASGLLPPDIVVNSIVFFDRALPPTRVEIFAELKKIFGANIDSIKSVRQVVGSGSVNYVVLVDVRDPQTGQSCPWLFRIGREGDRGTGFLLRTASGECS